MLQIVLSFVYYYYVNSQFSFSSLTIRGVHQNPEIDPPAQTARANSKTGRPDAGDGSPPPKTVLGGSDGGFSSSKPFFLFLF